MRFKRKSAALAVGIALAHQSFAQVPGLPSLPSAAVGDIVGGIVPGAGSLPLGSLPSLDALGLPGAGGLPGLPGLDGLPALPDMGALPGLPGAPGGGAPSLPPCHECHRRE